MNIYIRIRVVRGCVRACVRACVCACLSVFFLTSFFPSTNVTNTWVGNACQLQTEIGGRKQPVEAPSDQVGVNPTVHEALYSKYMENVTGLSWEALGLVLSCCQPCPR